jgi:exonuclease III
MMKGLFWNSNCLRDQAKPRFLFDSVKEYNLDFIAILESKRSDFYPHELAHFCANKNYSWNWTPPRVCSGGILVGLNIEKFTVQNIVRSNFSMKFKLKNKSYHFEWSLIVVYGAAQDEEKEVFLRELVQTVNVENLPLIVGGDFNIILSPHEKNNNRYNNE